MTFLRRLWVRERPDVMSADWLKAEARRGDRIEFHGVNIRWPIRKVLDENTTWNNAKLKRRA